ncbi:hypothetical protein [Intestinimonas sp. MSJ-38]|uniref:hypothetical protein n=1 Tax=Intestinimonas sp. MSJ-38 TaxID=2841532 RepID=UPI001C127925|nr:hypothetical protein [Intestinimonas sp. MSJ-38]MBU5431402.1 hypothetical protein [Intestinimonas sp. MSJ-38]
MMFMGSDPHFAAVAHSVSNGKRRMMQNDDADLLSALWTLRNEVCGIAYFHGDQTILGQRCSSGDIRDAAFFTNWATKGSTGFFYHVASLSVFSFLRTLS